MAVGDEYVFPGFLTPVLTQLFFPKPPTTFFTCFSRGERRKYAGKKSCVNWGSNSKPPGHESDTLTTEPPGRANMNPKTLKHRTNLDTPTDTQSNLFYQMVYSNVFTVINLYNLYNTILAFNRPDGMGLSKILRN